MAKRFYRTAGLTRFLNTVYWWPTLPYDDVWDKWLRNNMRSARPAYWPTGIVKDTISRENSLIWIADQLVWVKNDPGTFGACMRWSEDKKIVVCSGRPSRKTQSLLRRELASIERNLDICDAQAALQGDDGEDVLSFFR